MWKKNVISDWEASFYRDISSKNYLTNKRTRRAKTNQNYVAHYCPGTSAQRRHPVDLGGRRSCRHARANPCVRPCHATVFTWLRFASYRSGESNPMPGMHELQRVRGHSEADKDHPFLNCKPWPPLDTGLSSSIGYLPSLPGMYILVPSPRHALATVNG